MDKVQLSRSLEILQPWLNGSTDPDTVFLWSNAQTRLWREFLRHWPAGELVKRIFILSPFWSEDAGQTLKAFLAELRTMGCLAADATVRLLTDAFEGPNNTFIPVLPPGYAAFDWASLGVAATAQAVSPKVDPQELGGMEGFTGSRALHAKVVLMEGTRNGLAYLGSANFTAHGWGLLRGETPANTEAGLLLRRSLQAAMFDKLLPDLIGEPITLGDGNVQALRAPENSPDDEPWPAFISEVLLSPDSTDGTRLHLLINVSPGSAALQWSARLRDKEGSLPEVLLTTETTRNTNATSFLVPLSPAILTRLLTEQEILIAWSECPGGRPVPLNVAPCARAQLPISPATQRIEETHLLSYYQGRISWEELFPDPEPPLGQPGSAALPPPAPASVDKSRIQSYQIREFVEALTGLRQDLQACTQSEPAMRLALFGPVSPLALAQTVLEAANSRRRTPTAAAFQLVEILACLNSARSFDVAEKLASAWQRHLDDATARTDRLLEQFLSDHREDLAANSAFHRYKRTVLAPG